MRNHPLHAALRLARLGRAIYPHERGSVLVEAAFALPLMIILLLGILLYGGWLMTAHSLQQAANDAARAAVAGMTTTERRALVDESVNASRPSFPLPGAQTIGVAVNANSGYYTVTLTYNLSNAPFFSAAIFPLPATQIQRSAVVRIAS